MKGVRAAAFDTNVLLLWLVARVDLSLLREFKRVSGFSVQDVQILQDLARPFKRLVTTPHVLSETSNFIGQAPSHRQVDLRLALRDFIEDSEEHYEASVNLSRLDEFLSLGLTDAALVLCPVQSVIVTTDFYLAGRIRVRGGNVIQFNDYRPQRIG